MHKYRNREICGVHGRSAGGQPQVWLNIVDSEPEIPREESPRHALPPFITFKNTNTNADKYKYKYRQIKFPQPSHLL